MGRLVTLPELVEMRRACRERGQRVVFTNGVFDILHRGHIEYLTRAKALGDILVVGMNADASVRRIKGNRRPIVTEGDRAAIVASLVPVDAVCLFEDDTPLELIRAVVPDILVKGADWERDAIVGKEIVEAAGGTVETIAFVPEQSTSGIIERILERYG